MNVDPFKMEFLCKDKEDVLSQVDSVSSYVSSEKNKKHNVPVPKHNDGSQPPLNTH